MARVFADTNVLFPFSVMDLMLALTEDDVHEVIWTEKLLSEWQHVIVREQRRSAESAATITAAIREFFADSQVPEDSYRHLIETMPGSDPDDHHHMAAALAGGARVIVTWNQDDFPAADLAARGLEVIDPDSYLLRLLRRFPREVTDTVTRLAGEKQRPPKTAHDLAHDLSRAGVPRFSARLDRLLDRPH